MIRKQFTFYESFWLAMKTLSKRERLAFVEAVCVYALYGEARELTGPAATAFFLVQPVLDTANKRAESGKLGGSKPKANWKQSASEGEKEIEKETEKEGEGPSRRQRRAPSGNVFAEMLREEGGLS